MNRDVDLEDIDAQATSALTFLFAGGALLGGLSSALPGRTDPLAAAGVAAVGLLVAAILALSGRRFSYTALNLILAAGSVCVAGGVLTSGQASSADTLLFVWIGLYSGVFFRRRERLLQLAVVAGAYAGVLLLLDDTQSADGAQQLLMVIGATAVASSWVAHLRTVIDTLLDHQRRLAQTDVLTQLPNRSELMVSGAESMERGDDTALLLVDLDDFKQINDIHGHAAGDELLHEVARRLRSLVRSDDLVARLGGDEFAILLRPDGDADTVADRVVRTLRRPTSLGDEMIHVASSVGVAVRTDQTGVEDLLRDADLAMYAAKAEGARWIRFEPSMRDAEIERRQIVSDLRTGIEHDHFSLRFQPIIDLATSDIALVETLVRWEHPERGLVGPDEFIPVAEATGLIVPLGLWVLDDACRAAAAWRDDAPGVTVNLSARQLLDDRLVDNVRDTIELHGIPAERLLIEITETSVMTDPDAAIIRLEALEDLGLGLAIDDFGTGHSSLEYLRRLPADTLKLARPFVRDMHKAPENLALARGIVGLAHTLGKQVIAEGVETVEQCEALQAMGCDFAQGYLFDRPLVEDDMLERLADRRATRRTRTTMRPVGASAARTGR